MTNYSDIALSEEVVRFRKKVSSLRESMGLLKDKHSDYYEHHQHLINTYKEIIGVIHEAIAESKSVGKGR